MNNINHSILHQLNLQRGLVFGILIVAALVSFEMFNYSTTDYALSDLLGDLKFLGIRWATILAIAFCGIDFAGIARLFTPEDGQEQPAEVWYLFAAWLLAATMNALLTWWGVTLAVLDHTSLGNAIVEPGTLIRVIPIFVAVMVWLIRVLIIGTFSVAGERLFSQSEVQPTGNIQAPRRYQGDLPDRRVPSRPAGYQDPENTPPEPLPRREPTYHPVSMGARRSPRKK
jgi:hypothetical protein